MFVVVATRVHAIREHAYVARRARDIAHRRGSTLLARRWARGVGLINHSQPRDAGDVEPFGLPITYTASPRVRKDAESLCDAADDSTVDVCSIVDATEVFDTTCRACRGAKLVKTTITSGGREKEVMSTCQVCGGAGVLRVASSRVHPDYEKGDSDAAEFTGFPSHAPEQKKLETRANPFYKFEKEVEARRNSMDESSMDESDLK